MLLVSPFEDLSVGKRKARPSMSDGKRLIGSARKIKSAIGGLTSMGARNFYVNSVGLKHQRAVVKVRVVKQGKGWDEIRVKHFSYIQREGVGRDGEKGELFSNSPDFVDAEKYLRKTALDKHEFRIIIAPEAATEIDLEDLTLKVIQQMELDLKTKITCVAVAHYNTENPHVHAVVRGVADDGKRLLMSKDYISNGIRNRTREILTNGLGLRPREEIELVYKKEISAERFTSIDYFIKKNLDIDSTFKLSKCSKNLNEYMSIDTVKQRLEYLKNNDLFHQQKSSYWKAEQDWEKVLRDKGMTNDIIKTMHREAGLNKSSCKVYSREAGNELKGHIVYRGIHEEMTDKMYIIVRDSNAKNHFVLLDKFSLSENANIGDKVTINTSKMEDYLRKADGIIESFARKNGGVYEPEKYKDTIKDREPTSSESKVEAYLKGNQKRLEQLAKIGIIKSADENGHWKIPETFISDVNKMAKEKGGCNYLRVKLETMRALDINKTLGKGRGIK